MNKAACASQRRHIGDQRTAEYTRYNGANILEHEVHKAQVF